MNSKSPMPTDGTQPSAGTPPAEPRAAQGSSGVEAGPWLEDSGGGRDYRQVLEVALGYVAPILLLFVAWDLLVRLGDIPKYLLPSPTSVFETLIVERSQLFDNTLITLQESVLGYLLAIAFALPTAILVTYSKAAAKLVYPILVVSQVVPKIAIAPLIIVWLGFGIFPKVIIAFLVAFFAIVVSTATGLNDIDPKMIHLARSMGTPTWKIFLRVRLPNSLPTFFGGLKVGVTLAVIGAIVGEFVGSGSGLGHLTVVAMGSLNIELVFAAIAMMAFIGVAMYVMVEIAERLLIPWNRRSRLEQAQAAA